MTLHRDMCWCEPMLTCWDLISRCSRPQVVTVVQSLSWMILGRVGCAAGTVLPRAQSASFSNVFIFHTGQSTQCRGGQDVEAKQSTYKIVNEWRPSSCQRWLRSLYSSIRANTWTSCHIQKVYDFKLTVFDPCFFFCWKYSWLHLLKHLLLWLLYPKSCNQQLYCYSVVFVEFSYLWEYWLLLPFYPQKGWLLEKYRSKLCLIHYCDYEKWTVGIVGPGN